MLNSNWEMINGPRPITDGTDDDEKDETERAHPDRRRAALVGRQFYGLCECGPVDEWSQRSWRWASSLVLLWVRAAPRLDRTICQSAGQRQPEWACQPSTTVPTRMPSGSRY